MPKITLVLDLATADQTYTSTGESKTQNLAVAFSKMWSLNHHISSVCHKVCLIIGKDECSHTKCNAYINICHLFLKNGAKI